jgi:hypothetical protein
MKIPTPEEVKYMQLHVHETKVPGAIVSSVIIAVASTAAVLLRFVARVTSKAKLSASDWLLALALVRMENPSFCSRYVIKILYLIGFSLCVSDCVLVHIELRSRETRYSCD